MWVRLEADEIELILKHLPAGSLTERLRETPDQDTAAFVSAVDTNDDLEVDSDAVISRGDEGAFVMGWIWVSNEAAGIEMSDVDEDEDPRSPKA
ncbi:hypothetical protein [Rhizobium sp.]|uniref:hypothetical protein n=1 Tax=Rhizobium sp. TaxID=391 RepID=UPI00289DB768